MRDFWLVYADKDRLPGHHDPLVARLTARFETYAEAFDYAREQIKTGTGDLYIMKPTHRVHLPVDLETAEDEK